MTYCQKSLKWAIELTKESKDTSVQMLREFARDNISAAPDIEWDVDTRED